MVLVVLFGSYNINVFSNHAQKFKCLPKRMLHAKAHLPFKSQCERVNLWIGPGFIFESCS